MSDRGMGCSSCDGVGFSVGGYRFTTGLTICCSLFQCEVRNARQVGALGKLRVSCCVS